MATREQVYLALDSERDYQDDKWPARTDGQPKPVEGYIVMLNHYIAELNKAWTMNAGDDAALEVMRKIGGIVVHCGEDHHLPERAGYER